MIYFTSDWHIGHDKDFIYKARGFSSIEEHDTAILERCNEIVQPEDELWILGDLALNNENETEWDRVYTNLYCRRIWFLVGNHETDKRMDKYEFDYGFNYGGFVDIFKYNKHKQFYLSHYPTMVDNYNEKDRFFWNLSGHTHSKEKFHPEYKIYNVAVDAHNCYPVSIEDVIKDIYKHREETHG